MKSKIVKQFGAMLLAGTMIVTSGNVTTYAAEQTDESQEVDVNTESETEQETLYAESKSDEDAEVMQDEQNQELYGIDLDEVEKLEEGDGYLICRQTVDGEKRIVAHLWVDKHKSKRSPDEILQSILNSKYVDENSIVAVSTRYRHITVPKSVVDTLKEKNMELGVVTAYYHSLQYDEVYFKQIEDVDTDYSLKVEYDKDKNLLNKLFDMGIGCYMLTISNDDNSKKSFDRLWGQGVYNQRHYIERDLCSKDMNNDNLRLYYYDDTRDKYILLKSKIDYLDGELISYKKENGIKYKIVEAAVIATFTGVDYYGTYLVCNNTLPDSMVFNLTGLEKDGDSLLYYTNGLRDTSYTGLCDYDGFK